MKRHTVSALFLFAIFFLLTGCGSLRTVRGTGDMTAENREVNDFSAVDLAGIGTVIIDFGDKESLRIEAEDNLLPYLQSEIEGGTLILGVREGVNIVPTQGIFYYLTVNDLDEITVSGLGNIDLPHLDGPQVGINVNGGGDINIAELQADKLNVLISGLGDLNIGSGEVTTQTIEISGGGNYNAAALASDKTQVDISGVGAAEVWAHDELDGTISGGGSIRYNGHPQVTRDISGLGEIEPISGK